jgi:PTH1 family peptidyl-tRNA hydrolase
MGGMKIRKGGSGAGHHGVESIMDHLGTEMFWRFRMGIGANKNHREVGGHVMHNVDDFVLSDFSSNEAGKLRELIKRGGNALKYSLEENLEAAMNKYNTK